MYKLLVIMSLSSAISHVSGGAGSSNRETRETSLSITLMYQRHDRTNAPAVSRESRTTLCKLISSELRSFVHRFY